MLLLAQVATTDQTLLDAQTIALLSGVVIPLLVGLVSKLNASSGLKAIINAFLSAVAGTLATVTQVTAPQVRDFVIAILSTWVVSVATYYGVYKPTGVAGTVAEKTAGFGLGSPPVLQTGDKGFEDIGPLVADAGETGDPNVSDDLRRILDPEHPQAP